MVMICYIAWWSCQKDTSSYKPLLHYSGYDDDPYQAVYVRLIQYQILARQYCLHNNKVL